MRLYNKKTNKIIKFHIVKPIQKHLGIRKRFLGLNALDRLQIAILKDNILQLCNTILELINYESIDKAFIGLLMSVRNAMIMKYKSKVIADPRLNIVPGKIESKHRTIDSFDDQYIKSNFRFRNKEQLKVLFKLLDFPEIFYGQYGHKYFGEQVFLLGLYRLSRPLAASDEAYRNIFGYDSDKVIKMFKIFINFIYEEWSYLILNNMEYWVKEFEYFAECIQQKCASMGCVFKSAIDPNGGFNILGFIDNTMNASCMLLATILSYSVHGIMAGKKCMD
jgi:hypothetical protein